MSFQALLTTVVSSMALLAVSTTIVSAMALQRCPLRTLYQQFQAAGTPNLYELRGLDQSVLPRLDTEYLINLKPAFLYEAGNNY